MSVNIKILPLPVSYMGAAGLLPPKFDSNGNAPGYIVVSFGEGGRADYWTGDCWWNFREFGLNRLQGAVFTLLADAEEFVRGL